MTTTIDIAGQTFGHLTALKPSALRSDNKVVWLCICACGTVTTVRGVYLRNGHTRSCGCRRGGYKEAPFSGTATYGTWRKMHERCSNPKAQNFKWYGGRGVKVCDRWDDFENFLADMGERPDGLSIDRIDPEGNYEPSNCRWADRHTQRINRRPIATAELS